MGREWGGEGGVKDCELRYYCLHITINHSGRDYRNDSVQNIANSHL